MLTESRKADRATMSAEIERIAVEHGASFERIETGREIMIDICGARGLCLSMDLDGDSRQPDTHVLAWYVRNDERLSDRLGPVNPYHRRKATVVAYGWDALRSAIVTGLSMATDGSAFE